MADEFVNVTVNGRTFDIKVPKDSSDDFVKKAAKEYHEKTWGDKGTQKHHAGIHLNLSRSPEQDKAIDQSMANFIQGPSEEGIGSRILDEIASPFKSVYETPKAIYDWASGGFKPSTQDPGFSGDNPIRQIIDPTEMALLSAIPMPSRQNLQNTVTGLKGAGRGAWNGARSGASYRGMTVPAPIIGGVLGGFLGRDLGMPEAGAAIGTAAPIVKGAIEGFRDTAPTRSANIARAARTVNPPVVAPPQVRTPQPAVNPIQANVSLTGRAPGGLTHAEDISSRLAEATAGPIIPNAPDPTIGKLGTEDLTWPARGSETAPGETHGSGTLPTPTPPESFKPYGTGKLSDISAEPTWPPRLSAGQEPADPEMAGSEAPKKVIPPIRWDKTRKPVVAPQQVDPALNSTTETLPKSHELEPEPDDETTRRGGNPEHKVDPPSKSRPKLQTQNNQDTGDWHEVDQSTLSPEQKELNRKVQEGAEKEIESSRVEKEKLKAITDKYKVNPPNTTEIPRNKQLLTRTEKTNKPGPTISNVKLNRLEVPDKPSFSYGSLKVLADRFPTEMRMRATKLGRMIKENNYGEVEDVPMKYDLRPTKTPKPNLPLNAEAKTTEWNNVKKFLDELAKDPEMTKHFSGHVPSESFNENPLK